MRATAPCIHGSGKKRKSEDIKNNKYNPNKSNELKKNIRNKSIGHSESNFTSTPVCRKIPEEKKKQEFTFEMINYLYNSVKRSVKNLSLMNITCISSMLGSRKINMTEKDVNFTSLLCNEDINNLKEPLTQSLNNRQNLSWLSLTDNFCLTKVWFI